MVATQIQVIAKNNSRSEQYIYDMGISIKDGQERNLTQQFGEEEIVESDDLKNLISAGTIVINDGSRDLTIPQALDIFNIILGLELTETVGASGVLTPSEHKNIDQLVHRLSENCYVEYVKSGNQVTDVITWDSISKTKKIREENYVYSGALLDYYSIKQYDSNGQLSTTETHTLVYSGTTVVNETVEIT